MRKLILSAAACALMSSPAWAFHGWMMVAYGDMSANEEAVPAMVKRHFYSSEAQCLMGKGALEQSLMNKGQSQVNAVCVFVPEQQ